MDWVEIHCPYFFPVELDLLHVFFSTGPGERFSPKKLKNTINKLGLGVKSPFRILLLKLSLGEGCATSFSSNAAVQQRKVMKEHYQFQFAIFTGLQSNFSYKL